MYQVLGLKKLVSLFAAIVALVTLARIYVSPPSSFQGYLHLASSTGTFVLLAVLLIGETRFFHVIWRLSIIQKLFFPYIPGRWEGKIRSNWSVIAALREQAERGGAVDLSQFNVTSIGPYERDVVVEVEASFLRATVKLVTKDGYSDSVTLSIRPEREGGAGYPRLYYIYRDQVVVKQPTDASLHYGAAWMDIIVKKTGMTLKGVYWTEREWTNAMNTAGTLEANKRTSNA